MDIELLRQLSQRLLTLHGGQSHLRFESRRVVPAWSSAHRLSCSAAILAAVRQKLPLIQPVQKSRASSDRIRDRGSLRDQDIHLAQLRNDLFGGVSLLTHRDPPLAQKPYFRMDHSNGGGSLCAQVSSDQ